MRDIKRITLTVLLLFGCVVMYSQQNNQRGVYESTNAAATLLSSEKRLTIGGYGQIDYNQPVGDNKIQNGNLDVHRLVILLGYRFNSKLNFITEIEIEHVEEVYVEQAFLNYSVNTYLQLRGGLMLVPMGIINEYHEPTTFNGVERPLIDKYISPTTWREIGFGVTGIIPDFSLRYQAYLMNGFSSYNGSAQLSGSSGLRNGRQKGAKSIIRTPVITGRLEYYGIMGLNLGLSAYLGGTQSSMYKELNRNDEIGLSAADSSIVKINMFGFDVRYQKNGFQLRAQSYYTMLTNTAQYNYFTISDNKLNDVGSSMYGYYVEAGYNIFQKAVKIRSELTAFIRYSIFDTQNKVEGDINKDPAYSMQVITTGLSWKPISEVAIKADIQLLKSKQESDFSKVFNAGIAIWF